MENRKIAEEIIRQLQLFSLSGAYGVLLGIWYEFFRILRKTFVHKNRIVHLEDIIFCLTAAIGLFNTLISFTLVAVMNRISKKMTGAGLW